MKIEQDKAPGKFWNRDPAIFVFFLLLSLGIYFFVRDAGFVTDFIGFETVYDSCGFWHYYDCAGIKNFRYLQHAFSYVLYKTIGSDHILWYILYCSAHAFASFLGYRFLMRLFSRFGLSNGKLIAFFSALIFLISPYNTEVVVWKVCIQYITVMICFFLSGLQFFKYSDDWLKMRIGFVVLLFLIALFSLEQAVIIAPGLLLTGVIFYLYTKDGNWLRSGLIFSGPLFILTAGFFALSKIVYGKWIMHYGSQALDGLFSLPTYSNLYKYFFKHLLLFRYWKEENKIELIGVLDSPMVLGLLSCLALGSVIYLAYRTRKRSGTAGMLLLILFLYAISVAPVLSLFFTHDRLVANDRVGYIPSFFVYTLLVFILYRFFYRYRIVLLGLYIFIQSWFLYVTIQSWYTAQKVMSSYIKNFHFYDHKQVVVLSVPHSHRGVWMMLILGDNSGLAEALEYRGRHPYTGQMLEVSQYNQISEADGIQVETVNDSTLKVFFKHSGSWFDRNGVGLLGNDYSNAYYAVQPREYDYLITFKHLEKDHIIIYPDSLRWKSLTLPKFK